MHGTGIVDYGALGFMPTVGMSAAKTEDNGRLERFRHERETVSAGYYRVAFDGSETVTEVTAKIYVSLYRVTFARGADGHLLFDVGHTLSEVRVTQGEVRVDRAADELSGRVRIEGGYSDRVGGVDAYWVARVSRPVDRAGTWSHGNSTPTRARRRAPTWAPTSRSTPRPTGASRWPSGCRSPTSPTPAPTSRPRPPTSTSTGCAGSPPRTGSRCSPGCAPRPAESPRSPSSTPPSTTRCSCPRWPRTPTAPTAASTRWCAARRASGTTPTSRSGTPSAPSTRGSRELVYPEYQRDFLLLDHGHGRRARLLPPLAPGTGETGGMLGDCGALMVADTWLRGLRDYDVPHAWDIARRGAFATPSRREALEDYLSLHYVPTEGAGSSASKTLEYAYAYGALSRMARGLGHDADADALAQRSRNYRNLYDPAQRFLVGRSRDGSFAQMARAEAWQDFYAEGNAWQYLWYAPHDLDGLATLLPRAWLSPTELPTPDE